MTESVQLRWVIGGSEGRQMREVVHSGSKGGSDGITESWIHYLQRLWHKFDVYRD